MAEGMSKATKQIAMAITGIAAVGPNLSSLSYYMSSAIMAQQKNDRGIARLCHASGLSTQQAIEKVQSLPYSLDVILNYYLEYGVLPNG